MYRSFTLIGCVALTLFGGVLQAQAQFTVNAAATDAVTGWQKMEVQGRAVWVNPTPAVTSVDIQGAQPRRGPDGRNTVAIVFSDAGAKKMRELTAAQINKPIAMVLDGKLIFAPTIRGEISKDAVVTGNGPNGLSLEEVQRILASVNQKQK